MQYNREIVQKADLALADLAPGGILTTKQAAKFLKIAIKKNVMTSQVRATTMTNPVEEQPKLLWTGRVMHPSTEGVALASSLRAKPSFDKMTLTSKSGKAEVHMHREVLEDQIERGTFQSTLTSFMAEKVSSDIEDAVINGDTASSDDWLALQDGLIKLCATNVFPAGNVALSGDVLRDLVQTLPEEFDDQPNMKFYTNRKARSDLRSGLRTDHPDSLGASVHAGTLPAELGYDGTPVVRVPLFPNALGAANRTAVMYMDAKNFVLGFHRRITLDTEFRISEQTWVIVVTLRMALQYEHEPAAAKATQVIG